MSRAGASYRDQEKQQIRELFQQRLSDRDIGAILGRSQSAISKVRYELGLRRDKGDGLAPKVPMAPLPRDPDLTICLITEEDLKWYGRANGLGPNASLEAVNVFREAWNLPKFVLVRRWAA